MWSHTNWTNRRCAWLQASHLTYTRFYRIYFLSLSNLLWRLDWDSINKACTGVSCLIWILRCLRVECIFRESVSVLFIFREISGKSIIVLVCETSCNFCEDSGTMIFCICISTHAIDNVCINRQPSLNHFRKFALCFNCAKLASSEFLNSIISVKSKTFRTTTAILLAG